MSEKDLLLPKYATKSSHSVEGAGAELCGEIQHMWNTGVDPKH